MQLYNYRNKIIRLFENKNIRPSMYTCNAKSKSEEYDEAEKSEQKFDESIGEIVKLRREKADDKKDDTGDEQLDTTDIPELRICCTKKKSRRTTIKNNKSITNA